MNFRQAAGLGTLVLFSQLSFADASYQETTQITGGSMADGLKSVSFLSKSLNNMFAPMTTTTMVHGNQKAVVSKDSIEITDLDRETVTRIDTAHKTYSVVTFEQMRQAFANVPKQMERAQAQVKDAQAQQPPPPKTDIETTFDVSAKNTGVTKEINGITAQEQVVTMQMHMTDPNAAPADGPNSMTYVVTTDTWIAPDPPQVKEVQDFDLRFAQKLMAGVDLSAFKAQMMQMRDSSQNPALMQMFGGKPGSAEAMAQMGKEMAKLQGTRVMEVTRMGGSATGPAGAQDSAQAAPASGSNQGSSNSAAQPASVPTSAGSAASMLGSALGSSVLGGFHRKKAQPAADPTPTTTTTTSADGTQTTSTVLMEMTMQKTNFSGDTVAASNFQVPPGFKKVDSPMYSTAGK
jgi:hypothetical protein